MKPPTQPIVREKIVLRLLEEGDLGYTLDLRNLYRRNFISKDGVSREDHRKWFLKYLEKEDDFVFAVVDRETGRLAGQASIYSIDPEDKTAEFGRLMVGADFLGRGYGREATLALLELAASMGIKTVFLTVYEWNLPAKKIYDDLGFKTSSKAGDILFMSRKLNE